MGRPLPVDSACSVVNFGVRLAGRFQYERLTFTRIAGAAGFDVESVTCNEGCFPELRNLDLRRPAESVSMYSVGLASGPTSFLQDAACPTANHAFMVASPARGRSAPAMLSIATPHAPIAGWR